MWPFRCRAPEARPLTDRERYIELLKTSMRCLAGRGGLWPEGEAEAIADAMLGHDDRAAIDIAERELKRRDVGGRNTFAHGSGI